MASKIKFDQTPETSCAILKKKMEQKILLTNSSEILGCPRTIQRLIRKLKVFT